ncbi:translation initiation factor IF-2-like [Microtus oregoni]|uniref:translation initiation factor IF-2-like n=1 Tax=Microtus oregoni TaxID=111838 RepID=UPI001BB17A19|nr:translation initiation factor IF-2-like [Microtus oregoni]
MQNVPEFQPEHHEAKILQANNFKATFPSSPIYKASHQIPAAPSGKRNAKNVNAFPGAGPNRTVHAAVTHLPLSGEAQTREEINATFQRKLCSGRLQQGRPGPGLHGPDPALGARPRTAGAAAQSSRRKRTPRGRERAPALGTGPPGAAPSPRASSRAGPGRHGAAPSRGKQNANRRAWPPARSFSTGTGPSPTWPGARLSPGAGACKLGPLLLQRAPAGGF